MALHLRLGPELWDWWSGWLDRNSSRYVVGEEVGSLNKGLHYHTHFVVSIKKDAVRKAINARLSELGLKGERGKENKYYGGLKEWDADISYIVKEGKVVASNGYTPEELDAAIKKGAAEKARIEGAKQQPKAKATQDKKQFIETLIEECVSHIRECKCENNYQDATFVAVKFFLKAYNGRIDDFRLFPLVRSAIYQLGGVSKHAVEQKAYDTVLSKLAPYRPTYMSMSESGSNAADLISHE